MVGSPQFKGKGEVVPCLINHNSIKTYGWMEVQLQVFLTLALDGSEWSA
jgi:hypothetical protein